LIFDLIFSFFSVVIKKMSLWQVALVIVLGYTMQACFTEWFPNTSSTQFSPLNVFKWNVTQLIQIKSM
jgi:hypothetical protein